MTSSGMSSHWCRNSSTDDSVSINGALHRYPWSVVRDQIEISVNSCPLMAES